MNSNYDIFEPNHITNEARLAEDTGVASGQDESDNSVYYSESSQSSAASASSANSHTSIKWILAEKFEDISDADKYVKNTSTRDSSKPLCIFFNKLETLKHKMFEQTRLCRSKPCQGSYLTCTFKIKYQKCKPCNKANVIWQTGEHPVEQISATERRGIDSKVKLIIDDVITKSVRPIDVFVYLNEEKTKQNEMKDLDQPTLLQLQSYLKTYRVMTLGSGVNTKEEIIQKIKSNMYYPGINEYKGFLSDMRQTVLERQSSTLKIFELRLLPKNCSVILKLMVFRFTISIIHLHGPL